MRDFALPINRSISLMIIATLGALLGSCGAFPITLGGGTSSTNDAVPSGVITAQGSFTSLNGKVVTGTAVIYFVSSGNYIVRLNGISVPSENALQMVPVIDGTAQTPVQLESDSGNQDYSVEYSGTPGHWNQVNIHSTIYNLDYGQALLQCASGATSC